MAIIVPLETENVQADYDAEAKILRVTYKGVLTPQVTVEFYTWLGGIMQQNPTLILEALGSIFDFRQVTDFKSSNITTVRKQSQTVTQNPEAKNHPVALVVETIFQERMVSVTLKMTEQQDRKKVVNSIEEAQDYIAAWHKKQQEV
jgi:hypothetical protein